MKEYRIYINIEEHDLEDDEYTTFDEVDMPGCPCSLKTAQLITQKLSDLAYDLTKEKQ